MSSSDSSSRGITTPQRSALEKIAGALETDSYLAGGVAVALSVGHRLSIDLDVFVPHDFDAERLLERIAATVPGAREVGRGRATLHMEVEGVPVSILGYRYPLLAEPRSSPGLPIAVASLDDLACMKLSAIAGRGAAKDFWDLDELLAKGVGGGTIAGILELFRRKFAVEDMGHVVRALAYFGEADAAPLPAGLSDLRWRQIKQAFRGRVAAL